MTLETRANFTALLFRAYEQIVKGSNSDDLIQKNSKEYFENLANGKFEFFGGADNIKKEGDAQFFIRIAKDDDLYFLQFIEVDSKGKSKIHFAKAIITEDLNYSSKLDEVFAVLFANIVIGDS